MTVSKEKGICGLCGRPLDAQHSPQEHDFPTSAEPGNRVEYVVVEVRGAVAHYQAVDNPSKTNKTGAVELAEELGIDSSTLVGRHYTCLVTPAEYGVIRSDFRLA
ncbi:hypothetical protein [Streptomyces sp. NPDC051452]|uniref:hypothetical protein n=1 Tax=Streptomyces sp. NPDC051452 TaxID=3365654 RepID=UPI00379FE155